MPLKYLFTAEYKDGTTYVQNPEDVSVSDKTRSCFFDLKQEELKSFHLSDGQNVFAVDLEDGHFEVNGVPFSLDERKFPDYRLIFWREHTHTIGTDFKETAHDTVYLLGWQANGENGENVKYILRII